MKIVLAYSGGLDTSVILRWLKEIYQAEIIAFCADIGQEEELAGLELAALEVIEDSRRDPCVPLARLLHRARASPSIAARVAVATSR